MHTYSKSAKRARALRKGVGSFLDAPAFVLWGACHRIGAVFQRVGVVVKGMVVKGMVGYRLVSRTAAGTSIDVSLHRKR